LTQQEQQQQDEQCHGIGSVPDPKYMATLS